MSEAEEYYSSDSVPEESLEVEEDESLSFEENQPQEIQQDSYSPRIHHSLTVQDNEDEDEKAYTRHHHSHTIAAALTTPPLSPSHQHRINSPSSVASLKQQHNVAQTDAMMFDVEFQSMLSMQPPSSSPFKLDPSQLEEAIDSYETSTTQPTEVSPMDAIYHHPSALQILNASDSNASHLPHMSRTEKDPVVARLLNRVQRKHKAAMNATHSTDNEQVISNAKSLQTVVGDQWNASAISALCNRLHSVTSSSSSSNGMKYSAIHSPPQSSAILNDVSLILQRSRLSQLQMEWTERQQQQTSSERENLMEKENIENALSEFPHPSAAAYSATCQPLSLLVSQLKVNAALTSLRTHEFGQEKQQLPVAKTTFQDVQLHLSSPPHSQSTSLTIQPVDIQPSSVIPIAEKIAMRNPSASSNLDGLLNHLYKQRKEPRSNQIASNQQQIQDELFLTHNSINSCYHVFRNSNLNNRT